MSIQFYNIVKILDFILFQIKRIYFYFCSKLFFRLILKKLHFLQKYNTIHLNLRDLQSSTISLVAFY